jgi:hypothetical protein
MAVASDGFHRPKHKATNSGEEIAASGKNPSGWIVMAPSFHQLSRNVQNSCYIPNGGSPFQGCFVSFF